MCTEMSYLEQVARGLVKLATGSVRAAAHGITTMFVILMIDRSPSMLARCGKTKRLGAAKNAAIQLVATRLQQGADDCLSVIAFDRGAFVVLPFTRCRDHRKQIERSIRSIRIGNGTDLAAPLTLAQQELIAPQQRTHIVLLSDGEGGDPLPVARALKEAGTIIETVGVADAPSEVNAPIMKATASIVEGKVLYRFIRDADELSDYFCTEIANRLVQRSRS